jgi:hypothetical protein
MLRGRGPGTAVSQGTTWPLLLSRAGVPSRVCTLRAETC